MDRFSFFSTILLFYFELTPIITTMKINLLILIIVTQINCFQCLRKKSQIILIYLNIWFNKSIKKIDEYICLGRFWY